MSFLVTRPARPLPGMALRSRLCSAAIFRTSGVDLRRRRSSAVSLPPLPPASGDRLGAAGAAGRLCAAAAGGGDAAALAAAGRAGAARSGARAGGGAGAADGAGVAAAGGAGAAVGATAAPASVSIVATTVCTATVWPSVTRISARTPATGAGISASTLSVEISKIGSSRFTASPTFFIHRDRVPSAMDSPICGMITSILAILFRSPVSTPQASGRRARYPRSAAGRSPRAAARTAAGRRGRRRAAPARRAIRRRAR